MPTKLNQKYQQFKQFFPHFRKRSLKATEVIRSKISNYYQLVNAFPKLNYLN